MDMETSWGLAWLFSDWITLVLYNNIFMILNDSDEKEIAVVNDW